MYSKMPTKLKICIFFRFGLPTRINLGSEGQELMNVIERYKHFVGAQWLSGRVLDSRPKGRGFKPHRRHCVVVLEQDTFILA